MTLQKTELAVAEDQYSKLTDEIDLFQEEHNNEYTPAEQRKLTAMYGELDRLYQLIEHLKTQTKKETATRGETFRVAATVQLGPKLHLATGISQSKRPWFAWSDRPDRWEQAVYMAEHGTGGGNVVVGDLDTAQKALNAAIGVLELNFRDSGETDVADDMADVHTKLFMAIARHFA